AGDLGLRQIAEKCFDFLLLPRESVYRIVAGDVVDIRLGVRAVFAGRWTAGAHRQYASMSRAARSICSSLARNSSSSGGEYGTGVSSAPITRTGASSQSNASS